MYKKYFIDKNIPYVVLALLLFGGVVFTRGKYSRGVKKDARTSLICRNAAQVNHKKYILTKRWEVWGKDWEEYDWYQACIDNIRYTSPLSK